MTLAQRLDRLSTAGGLPDAETIRATLEQVEASIAVIAADMPEDDTSMNRWWNWCRELATRDPMLATLYAGFTWDDLAL